MILDIVEGQRRGRERGPKMAKIQYGVKPDIFKCARAGTECVAHVLQGLTDPHTTVLWVDGVSLRHDLQKGNVGSSATIARR